MPRPTEEVTVQCSAVGAIDAQLASRSGQLLLTWQVRAPIDAPSPLRPLSR